MQIESKMRFVIVLLLKFDLIQGKENTSTEKVWEKWGKPFGCKEDYLVLNYQNRNPIRGACLPRGYAENVAPIPDGTTGILVSYNHIKFLDLKEKQNTFTVDVKKSYYWQDHTIVANVDNYTNHIIFVPEVEFPALWKPSPKISNMKTMKPALEPSVYTELQLLIGNNVVSKYTVLKVTMEYWVTIYCSLDFQDFPFDIQKCTFKDVNRAKDRHTWLLDSTNQLYQILRKLDQDFEMIQTHKKTGRGFDIIVELRNFTNGNGFEIELKRLIGPYLLQYYVPCFSIVGMSFVSFLVPYSAIPGRIALIATQFLTLTNIFVHHMGDSVSKAKVTMLGIYILVSFSFVVGTMIEFAIILWLKQEDDNDITQSNDTFGAHFSPLTQISINGRTRKIKDCKNDNETNRKDRAKKNLAMKIDRLALVLFTVTYLIFNITYFLIKIFVR